VLDEAHCMRNEQSQRYTNLYALKSKHRLLLSGTPVQNDVKELLSLLSFLMSRLFTPSSCEMLIETFGWENKGNSGGRSADSPGVKQLRKMLAPFVLRRLKKDVLDQLVAKKTFAIMIDMTTSQKGIYEGLVLSHATRKVHKKEQHDAETAMLQHKNSKSKKKPIEVYIHDEEDETVGDGAGRRGGKGGVGGEGGGKAMEEEEVQAEDEVERKSKKTARSSSSASNASSVSPSSSSNSSSDSPEIVCVVPLSSAAEVQVDDEAFDKINNLSAKDAQHLFTALRKAANHPLLLRVRFNDEAKLTKIANVAFTLDHFGNQVIFSLCCTDTRHALSFNARNIYKLTTSFCFCCTMLHVV